MNIIWLIMIILATFVLIFTNPSGVLNAMLNASKSAVSLCINLLGIYAVWLGIINILDRCGLSDKLAKIMSPLIKKLFKSDNETANKYIAINISSNILGLGNAATPSGIKAMSLLDDKSGKINFSGIMLLVINSVSLQLIPITVIGLRESAGSQNAASILIPTIFTSIITCIFAISITFLFKKIFGNKRCKR